MYDLLVKAATPKFNAGPSSATILEDTDIPRRNFSQEVINVRNAGQQHLQAK